MTRYTDPHPAIVAFLIAAGAALMLIGGFLIAEPEAPKDAAESGRALHVTAHWVVAGGGLLLYLAGGILFGRTRGFTLPVALIIHLLPVLGLIIMALLRPRLAPYETWRRDFPHLHDSREARRASRTVKALY